jgi:hypothetical protein
VISKSLFIKFINALIILVCSSGFTTSSHEVNHWPPQQTIPGYHPDTWPPILLADQNRTIHAFSSQWIDEGSNNPRRVIVYNRWTLDQGWNEPIDILLPSLKDDARLTSAVLDLDGVVHLVFLSGDNTQANLYYSNAPVISAGDASAWSKPVLVADHVQTPENGAIFVQDSGNLGILFAGTERGPGIYATYSIDGGNEWSHPVSIFNTANSEMLVNNLQIYQARSGQIHAMWNEITSSGQGRGIYYTTTKTGDPAWHTPIVIAEAESGYGTNTPAIIEHNGTVYAFYNLNGIMMRRSMDGGTSWSKPIGIFSRYVGVNGSLSLVVDSNGDLHLFFGQRITGNPDIHGMWHSVWEGEKWSEPEAIVSGPAVADQEGETAFDPFEARGVVSQGNVLLVTWRSDPGLKGNGVWYSYKSLDAPELPIIGMPTPVQPKPTPELTSISPTPTQMAQEELSIQPDKPLPEELVNESVEVSNPIRPLMSGLVPAIIIVALVIVLKRRSQH